MIIYKCDKCACRKQASTPHEFRLKPPEGWQTIQVGFNYLYSSSDQVVFLLCPECLKKLGLDKEVRVESMGDQLFGIIESIVAEAVEATE